MKESELKFKIGDRVRLKGKPEPVMHVSNNETGISLASLDRAFNRVRKNPNEVDEPLYTGLVKVTWINSKEKQEWGKFHQDLLELAS